MIDTHRYLPYHWPEEWIDKDSVPERTKGHWQTLRPTHYGYFKRTSLLEVGLHVGLGHDGDICPKSHEADTVDITVLHTTGQHLTRFRLCACSSKPLWYQLLEMDLFPVTEKNPRTAFTIEVLRHQRSFHLRSKTSLKDYYDAIVDLTSAAEDRGQVSVRFIWTRLRLFVRKFITLFPLIDHIRRLSSGKTTIPGS